MGTNAVENEVVMVQYAACKSYGRWQWKSKPFAEDSEEYPGSSTKRNVPKHHLIKGNLLCFMLDISRHHIFLSYCHVYPHKFPSDWSQKSWKSSETFPEELSAPVQSTTNIATSDILGQLCQDLRAASAILATKMPLKRVQPDDMLPEGLAGFGKSKSKQYYIIILYHYQKSKFKHW